MYTQARTVVRTYAGLCEGWSTSRVSCCMLIDDLVLMAPTMEQLGKYVAEWRASLLDKGLNVNAGKLKWWLVAVVESGHVVSVGRECRQPLVSAQYVKRMIHKRRSGVHGDLSRVDNGFRCRRCDGKSQEAVLVGGWRDIWMCKEFLLSGRHS